MVEPGRPRSRRRPISALAASETAFHAIKFDHLLRALSYLPGWEDILLDRKTTITIAVAISCIGFAAGLYYYFGRADTQHSVSEAECATPSDIAEIAPAIAEYSKINRNIGQLNQKIDRIDASIAALARAVEAINLSKKHPQEKRSTDWPMPPMTPFSPGTGPAGAQKPMGAPTDWLSGLDDSTRAQVDEIFKKNALRMREALQNLGPIENADRNAIQQLMEENQETLKNELKQRLSPEDYEKFLHSLPPLPEKPSPVASPGLR